MRISMEAVLAAAGIESWEGPVEVLRDGFPSCVVRVRSCAYPRNPTVILKACPDVSREPDTLLCLHRAGLPVPAVLDVKKGDGFRVVVLEDAGTDALYKHPDPEWYIRAVRRIAKVHRQSMMFALLNGPGKILAETLPQYDMGKWQSVVRSGLEGTLRRLRGGTYTGLDVQERQRDGQEGSQQDLQQDWQAELHTLAGKSLSMITEWGGAGGSGNPDAPWCFPPTLVHGDYHDGNVLIRQAQDSEPGELVIVDWDSARWDSGFFDLVSLYDVAERMRTCRLDREELIDAYLREMLPEDIRLTSGTVRAEWNRCCILRAWDELRWFSESGEDFGDRAGREVGTIRSHLSWFG